MPSASSGHLRPFEIRRDLKAVADLVEQCFADTLDVDGQRYLSQMRSAARNPGFLRWAGAVVEQASMPLSGYVWEEDGRIVGNLSLIPFHVPRGRLYLIANVAVHPSYRRRGIARSLTARAIEHARSRGAISTWLHVREDNEGAVNLYRSLGFSDVTVRTTWHSTPDWVHSHLSNHWRDESASASRYQFGARTAGVWPMQKAWLLRLYPPELSWHLPVDYQALGSGFLNAVYRFFSGGALKQWVIYSQGRPGGFLTWKPTGGYADTLWLAIPEIFDESAVRVLLEHGRRHLSSLRPLALDFPAGIADQAIQNAGFHIHQTLIWMTIQFR